MNENEKYLEALLTGNDLVIKEMYAKIFPKVQSYILNNKGGKGDALDVFHDALMYIMVKHKEKALSIQSFEAYVYVVCRNLWKKNLKTKVMNSDFNTLEYKAADQTALGNEQQYMDFYIEKFQLLSPNCKEVLGNYFNGWTYEELAEELNYSSVNTIRQRVFKCRTKLTSLIKNDKRYQKLKEWKLN